MLRLPSFLSLFARSVYPNICGLSQVCFADLSKRCTRGVIHNPHRYTLKAYGTHESLFLRNKDL